MFVRAVYKAPVGHLMREIIIDIQVRGMILFFSGDIYQI